eukprot:3325009-Alexandrium_andersonii.AAC.1
MARGGHDHDSTNAASELTVHFGPRHFGSHDSIYAVTVDADGESALELKSPQKGHGSRHDLGGVVGGSVWNDGARQHHTTHATTMHTMEDGLPYELP